MLIEPLFNSTRHALWVILYTQKFLFFNHYKQIS